MHHGSSIWSTTQLLKRLKADPYGLTSGDHQVDGKWRVPRSWPINIGLQKSNHFYSEAGKVQSQLGHHLWAGKCSKTVGSCQRDTAVCSDGLRVARVWTIWILRIMAVIVIHWIHNTHIHASTVSGTCTHMYTGKRKALRIPTMWCRRKDNSKSPVCIPQCTH